MIYNIFDQAPQDELLPLCQALDIAVIARVPFDEGTLTGTLTKESTWPASDWRSTYFVPENLNASVDHAEALRPLVPAGMTMPELALRWILADPRVSTIIPGMRKKRNVEANIAASDGRALDPGPARTAQGPPMGPDADGLVAMTLEPVSGRLAVESAAVIRSTV